MRRKTTIIMNTSIIISNTTVNNGTMTGKAPHMTSLEIAELTGKNHFDVLRAIRNMEPAWEKVTECKFAVSEYKDSTGRKLPCYSLTNANLLSVNTRTQQAANYLATALPKQSAFTLLPSSMTRLARSWYRDGKSWKEKTSPP